MKPHFDFDVSYKAGDSELAIAYIGNDSEGLPLCGYAVHDGAGNLVDRTTREIIGKVDMKSGAFSIDLTPAIAAVRRQLSSA